MTSHTSVQSDNPDTLISSSDALAYWTSIPPTVNGMLGGYPQMSAADLKGSFLFYQKLLRLCNSQARVEADEKSSIRALDCGAGIGRITQGFLSKVCDIVDIIEPVAAFAEKARLCLEDSKSSCQVGEVYIQPLEAFAPTANHSRYRLIWIQWVAGHLTDDQLIDFLQLCATLLADHDSWIVIKENLSTDREGKDVFDPQDSSVTRTQNSWTSLFEAAGFEVKRTELQKVMPVKSLLPVRMWGLQAR